MSAPWTLFVTPGFADRSARLWWLELEEAIRVLPRLTVDLPDGGFSARSASDAEKQLAFNQLYWRLRKQPEAILLSVISELTQQAGVDVAALVERECLPWETLRSLSGAPDVTIGAHTLTHPMLAKHDTEFARKRDRREQGAAGVRARHPDPQLRLPGRRSHFGRPREFALAGEAGFASAVTTRPGHLFAPHARHLQALPRVSLNGCTRARRRAGAALGLALPALEQGPADQRGLS
jgi:peptidoglycan/xylan/chitin deacetylase (PgdA/CDA1 family)